MHNKKNNNHNYYAPFTRRDDDNLVMTSLPDRLSSEPLEETASGSGRPRSMLFVRAVTLDATAEAESKVNHSRYIVCYAYVIQRL